VNSEEMITFAPEVESWNGWWHIFGCSLNAIYSRMWNWVRSPIRNPVFPQFPRLPLFKEILQILTKILKSFGNIRIMLRFLHIPFYTNNSPSTILLFIRDLSFFEKRMVDTMSLGGIVSTICGRRSALWDACPSKISRPQAVRRVGV